MNKPLVKLIKNFTSLSGLQLFGYLFPLISMPYLVSVLGLDKFGLIILGQTISGYFTLFVDYGFSLSTTKEIAENKEDSNKVNKIFTSVMLAKLLLFTAGLIILHFLVSAFSRLETDYWVYIFSYGVVLGNVLFPVWYFMGIEKMEYCALFNILPKIFFLVLLFLLVNEESDYIYVPILFSLGFILSGVLSLVYSFRIGVTFTKVSTEDVNQQFKNGWHVFMGMLSSGLASNAIPLFLGLMTSNAILGMYSAVEKIIKPVANISNSLLNVIYPHMVNLRKNNNKSAFYFSKKISTYYLLILTVGCVIFSLFSKYLIDRYLGVEYVGMNEVLEVLIYLPFLTSFLNIFLISNCLVYDLKNVYSNSLFTAFLISLLVIPVGIHFFGIVGAGVSALIVELVKIIIISPFVIRFTRSSGFV